MPRNAVAARRAIAAIALLSSCASQRTDAPPAPPPPPSAQPAAPPPSAAPPAASSAPQAAPAPPPEPPATPRPPRVDLGKFRRDLEVKVVSFALGEKRAGALGDDAWLFDKGRFEKIPFHGRIKPFDRGDGRIFFGRDDRPRIMGVRHVEGRREQLYLRHKNGKWLEDRHEIAKLRDPPPEGMFGLLGNDDPEVVCKIGDDCIIKRRTGWKMMKAGPFTRRVELHLGIAWALHTGSVARLEDDRRWVTVGDKAPFGEPGGLFAAGDDVWVSEPATSQLHHLLKGAWQSVAAPVEGPRGMWGTGPSDIWLAGKTGLAHYDGKQWSLVEGPEGPLSEVYGRGNEVWASGESGVWSRR